MESKGSCGCFMDSHELRSGSMELEKKRKDGDGTEKVRKMGLGNRVGEARLYGKRKTEVEQIKNKGSKKSSGFLREIENW